MKRLLHLLSKPPRIRRITAWAFLLAGYYRWILLHSPFSELARKLGEKGFETAKNQLDQNLINDVASTVSKVCAHTPWESKCLVQALTAKRILNQFGLPCTLYMGVAKNEANQMIAHAWLRCGTEYVTGYLGSKQFTITGIFGDRILRKGEKG